MSSLSLTDELAIYKEPLCFACPAGTFKEANTTTPCILCERDTYSEAVAAKVKTETPKPTPSTLHPQPFTLNPTPLTLHHQPYTFNPTPSALHPKL